MTMWLKGGAAGSVKANWVCEIVCTSVSTGRPETITPNIVGRIGRTLGQVGGGVKTRVLWVPAESEGYSGAFGMSPWRSSALCLSINVTQEDLRDTGFTLNRLQRPIGHHF